MTHYEIRVAGTVSTAELAELDDWAVSSDGACLRLAGDVVDVAALQGTLTRLTGLGLTLIEVTRAGDAAEPSDVVRLRGRAGATLARRFPDLAVREEDGVTELSGPLGDTALLELLGLAQALHLDVLEVRRSEGAQVTPLG
jgi:hypothetical protein